MVGLSHSLCAGTAHQHLKTLVLVHHAHASEHAVVIVGVSLPTSAGSSSANELTHMLLCRLLALLTPPPLPPLSVPQLLSLLLLGQLKNPLLLLPQTPHPVEMVLPRLRLRPAVSQRAVATGLPLVLAQMRPGPLTKGLRQVSLYPVARQRPKR